MEQAHATINIKPPRPEKTRVKLVSVAISKPTFTPHRFVETVAGILPAPLLELVADERGPDRRCWFFIYECAETGFRRRFGCVDRTIDVPEAEVMMLSTIVLPDGRTETALVANPSALARAADTDALDAADGTGLDEEGN